MRIIGKIDHSRLNITVFSNDGRFPVQFELRGLTQIYRFRQDEQIRHLGDIQRIIDDQFIETVLEQFTGMQALHARTLREQAPAADGDDDLPVIM